MFNLFKCCCGKKSAVENGQELETFDLKRLNPPETVTSQPDQASTPQFDELGSLMEHLGETTTNYFELAKTFNDLQIRYYDHLPGIMESAVKDQVMDAFNIQTIDYLSRGGFGQVFRVRTKDEQCFVLKVQSPRYGAADRLTHYWQVCREEINLLRTLRHKNVMHLAGYRTFTSPELFNLPVYTVMQCEDLDMSLSALLEKVKRVHLNTQFTTIANDLGAGLAYLHKLGISHHDLKTKNVMATSQAGPRLYEMAEEVLQAEMEHFTFKIIDLGLAKKYPNNDLLSVWDRDTRGTIRWMCPQKARMESYNPFLSDVHALGLVLLACLMGDLDLEVIHMGRVDQDEFRRLYATEWSVLTENQQRVLSRMVETEEYDRPMLVNIFPLKC